MSTSQIIIHTVWCTRNRAWLLHPDDDQRFHNFLIAKARQLDCNIVAVGNSGDHVHALVWLNPSVSLANLMQHLKGASSFQATSEGRDLSWQRGYFAASCDSQRMDEIVAYVLNQRAHHEQHTVEHRYEPGAFLIHRKARTVYAVKTTPGLPTGPVP